MGVYRVKVQKRWTHSGKAVGRFEWLVIESNKQPKVGESQRNGLYTTTIIKVAEE